MAEVWRGGHERRQGTDEVGFQGGLEALALDTRGLEFLHSKQGIQHLGEEFRQGCPVAGF